ncbi:MAG: hypothetical protein P794_02880 [Epsilonproteobacteria bacterium (ex Lamellibrachia satsuma)]|nr:MAG: hypothetical protein P794_02880 [Epsilonproteobacteria bacterium (ex Lamellibrachia satsuma)]
MGMKKILNSVATLIVLGGTASAAITYTTVGGFVGNTGEGTKADSHISYDGTPIILDGENVYRNMHWGVAADHNRSGFTSGEPGGGSGTVTLGVPVEFASLTHHNFPITSAGGSLEYVKLKRQITLSDGNTSHDFSRVFAFDLYNWETPNNANPCPSSDPLHPYPIYTFPIKLSNGQESHVFTGGYDYPSPCYDAHDIAKVPGQDFTWVAGDTVYNIEISGFYDEDETLTKTFWAAEGGDTSGHVHLVLTELGPSHVNLGDRVWVDINSNGLQDTGENHTIHAGIDIELYEEGNTSPIQTVHPDSNGNYSFLNVETTNANGGKQYQVKFVLPVSNNVYQFTQQNAGSDDTIDSDVDASGVTEWFDLNDNNDTIDAGLVFGAIGDYVWVDKNQNGIQDDDEVGLDNVTVNLYKDGNTTVYRTTQTGLYGAYGFEPLGNGSYTVEFKLPEGYRFSPQSQGGDDTVDSDADVSDGRTRSITIDLDNTEELQHFDNFDAGMFQELNITKEVNTTIAMNGEFVMYTITVTNNSERNATDVNVTDDLPSDVNYDDSYSASQGTFDGSLWEVGLLEANGGSAELNITVEVDAASSGNVDNNACVVTEQNSIPICDDVNFAVITPAITVEKSTNGQDADTGSGPEVLTGSTVTWDYNITNTGDATLTNINVTDDQEGAICTIESLAAGASQTCTATGTATTGQYENNATVTAMSPTGTQISDSDLSHYYAEAPSIDIEKFTNGQNADTGTGPEVDINSTITWTYVVTNTGDVNLTNINVNDNPEGEIECPQNTLAVDESMTCTHTGQAIEGQYENNATVRGETTTRTAAQVSDMDSSHYYGGVCPCEKVKSDGSPAMNNISAALMMLMTLILGLFFVRREEELKRNER